MLADASGQRIVLGQVVWHYDCIVAQLVLQGHELVVGLGACLPIEHAQRVVIYATVLSTWNKPHTHMVGLVEYLRASLSVFLVKAIIDHQISLLRDVVLEKSVHLALGC